jgi:CubicO group peptidase (beta-lactamase class C family)
MRTWLGLVLGRGGLFVMAAVMAFLPGVTEAQTIQRERITAALPRLEAMIDRIIAAKEVPGLSVAIIHDDEVVYRKGFGLREIGKPDLVGADTVFQIASLSKPVSSTVVAALVGEGIVSWNSQIADIDPAFRVAEAYPTSMVTIRDLFAHRSGLPGGAGDDLEEIGYGRDEILRRLRLLPPASSFRSAYAYSNFGLTAGAVAAAKPMGRSWEDVAEEKLYRPLGMTSTSSRHADFLARPDRAALHIRDNGGWAAKVQRNPDPQAPAGGVSSTVGDLANWARLELGRGMFEGKRLIAADALDQTHEPLMSRGLNPVTQAQSFYGLGWNVEFGRHGLTWGHAGAFSAGARSLVTLYPKSRLGIVVLSNAFPTGVPEGVSDSFADMVFDGEIKTDWVTAWNKTYAGLFGPAIEAAKATYAMPPAPSSSPLALEAYEGRYTNPYVGEAIVKREAGSLVLKVGPREGQTTALHHFDRDLYLTYPDADMPEMPSEVRFSIGPDGRAAAVTIDFLDSGGLGTLQRTP